MKTKVLFVCVLFVLFGFSLSKLQFTEVVPNYPKSWPKPVYDFDKNPLSAEKIALGRQLFYDPILSKDSTISCASCHLSYTAFTHTDHALSHGIYDSIGTRNSPALINLAWNKSFMWDGAINHIEVQALAPINHPKEMGESTENVVAKLQRSPIYPALFETAFGSTSITGEHVLKAIAQFQLTFISANSKYDQVKAGTETFTEQEASGYKLFVKNCTSCHTEPLFTNRNFENNGLSIDPTFNDFGRFAISQIPKDSLEFKVPTLRNIEFSQPYMHDGRYKTLSEVLKFYAAGNFNHFANSEQLKSISLSANEQVDIIAFLLTLTDKEFLFNPDFAFPRK